MHQKIAEIAPAGFYVALRVGFSFPDDDLNALPENWVEFYTAQGLVVHDPALKWVYGHLGATRMAEIDLPDPQMVRAKEAAFGLAHGAVVSVMNPGDRGRRSYGLFYRADRAFSAGDLTALQELLGRLHSGNTGEPALTAAEIEALQMQAAGLRLKQIAGNLNISESAVKARLNNAKKKLGAKTLTQATSIASSRRLL